MTTREKVSKAKHVVLWCGLELDVEPQVGDFVQLDGGRIARLLEGDNFVDSSWPGCDFRFSDPVFGESRAVGCNVQVTGRKSRRRGGVDWVRVKVEWVGDCELAMAGPSSFTSGYLAVFHQHCNNERYRP